MYFLLKKLKQAKCNKPKRLLFITKSVNKFCKRVSLELVYYLIILLSCDIFPFSMFLCGI